MGDEFNIENVEKLINNTPIIEMSDISKIIKEMIRIKNDAERIVTKKVKSYDINDKINLNKLTDNLNESIKRHHIESYDIIDESINCIEEVEASIKSDLYDYYWEVYLEVLSDMEISIQNEDAIKENSSIIYKNIINKINTQIFIDKQSDIETNKRITYLRAITAYVFYKCKFLIPIINK